jgi:RsiW-degrading membrane proteinase PrsW (M82 family)
LRSPSLGRWRHLAILLPLGLAVGSLVGLIWNDLLFALAVGAGFAVFFGLIFAIRNVR